MDEGEELQEGEDRCVCDVIQSSLSPLPHTHTHRACFWHTALEELEHTETIHGGDAKDTLTQTHNADTHSKQTKTHVHNTNKWMAVSIHFGPLHYSRETLPSNSKQTVKTHIHIEIQGDKLNVPN